MAELAVTSESRTAPRDAFNGWFVTHEVAWELAMAALAVLCVALGFLVDEFPGNDREIQASGDPTAEEFDLAKSRLLAHSAMKGA